jgi:hypothetical protein
VSDFLINLALRAAGGLAVAAPERPVAWHEPQEPGLIAEQALQVEAARPAETAAPPSRERSASPAAATSPAPAPEPLEPHPAKPVERIAQPIPRPPSSTPERVTEIRTEHHDVVREPTAPPIEVRETIRETQKEIVRETLIEREVKGERPLPAPVVVHAPQPPAVVRPAELERSSKEIVHDVVLNTPTPLRPGAPPSAEPRGPLLEPRKPERVTQVAARPPLSDARPPSPLAVDRPAPSRPALPSAATTPPPDAPAELRVAAQPTAPRPPAVTTPSSAATPKEPMLRPSPPPAIPIVPAAEGVRTSSREHPVEVRIGAIEIRTPAPPAPPRASEPAPRREPIEGFERYRSVRRYSAWFRE